MKMKLNIDYSYIDVTFHLKPWKGKIHSINFLWDTERDFDEFCSSVIAGLRKEGLHKRRTITAITFGWHKNIKL